MRKKAGSWIIKFLLGAIILVFIFWGVGSFREKKRNQIGSVNGEPVTLNEFQNAYNSILEQLRQRFGSSFNDDMIKMFQVKSQAINRVVDQKLLINEAKRLGLRVTNKEIVNKINEIEAFKRAGAFDSLIYKRILNQMRLTPEEFEAEQRAVILIDKLRSFITDGVNVSELEAKEWYNWKNASVKIDYLLFKPGAYKDISPTEEEIASYFETHNESYKTEPKVKVRYLYFDLDAYIPKVKISDDELRDYYETNPEEFKKPKTVQARHILIKVDQDADAKTVEEKRQKALKIMKMAKEGNDFAKLAKEYSEGPSRKRGGYLEAFEKEDLVAPFSNKAFSMKPGEISDPVRTRFGWHIIKVEKVNEESKDLFKDAKTRIHNKMAKELAKNLAYDEAEEIYSVSFEGDDLVKAAEKRNLKIHSTDYFTRKGPEKGIINPSKFASVAFSLPVMEISDIHDFKDGYYILQVTEKIPAKIPDLEKVKEKVKADLTEEKKDEKAKKEAEKFLTALKNGNSMAEESEKYNLTPQSAGFFKRDDTSPVGLERVVMEASFKLSKEQKLPEDIIKGQNGYYVIKLRGRKEPNPEGFDKEEGKNIINMLRRQKEFIVFNTWLSELRNRSKITIEKGLLE